MLASSQHSHKTVQKLTTFAQCLSQLDLVLEKCSQHSHNDRKYPNRYNYSQHSHFLMQDRLAAFAQCFIHLRTRLITHSIRTMFHYAPLSKKLAAFAQQDHFTLAAFAQCFIQCLRFDTRNIRTRLCNATPDVAVSPVARSQHSHNL